MRAAATPLPALVFAAIPTTLVAVIEMNDLDPNQIGQIETYLSQFPDLAPKLAAQGFIVLNFMAYFLIIPAMVPMAIATQSVIGEKTARSLEPQLATPMEVSELLVGKAISAATPAIVATWAVFVLYGMWGIALGGPLLAWVFLGLFWHAAVSRYLRMSWPAAVAISVATVGWLSVVTAALVTWLILSGLW